MTTNSRKGRGGGKAECGARSRSGLSALEFIGCVIAVVGGMWLGALYLGIDVRHVFHEALAETDMLDKVPETWRPPGPENHMTREQLVATLREELGGLRSEISALRAGHEAEETEPAEAEAGTSTRTRATQASKEKTLAYWNRLNEIAMGEAALQADAESAFNEEIAAKVFAIKARISRFASKAVEAVPQAGVDSSVVQFGRQLSAWYDGAGELYDKAVRIWESSTSGSKTRAQLNEEWRRAELQHRNEARLLSEKATAVRGAAGRRFGHEFPEFVRPQADSPADRGAAGSSN